MSEQHAFVPCSQPYCTDSTEHCHHEWCGAPRSHSIHVSDPRPITNATPAIPERWQQRYYDFVSDDLPREVLEGMLKALFDEFSQAESERDQLREQRDVLLVALRDVEKHHVILNGKVGRGQEMSATLRIVRAAIQKADSESSKIAQVEENL